MSIKNSEKVHKIVDKYIKKVYYILRNRKTKGKQKGADHMKKNIQNIRKAVCTMANELRKQGLTLSQAFKKAWRRIEESMTMRVSGVTFNNGQKKLAYLAQFKPEDLRAYLKREEGNQYDSNAIKVYVTIPAEGKYTELGYIPAAVSKELAKIMDKGIQITANALGVIGGYSYKENYGFLLNVAI